MELLTRTFKKSAEELLKRFPCVVILGSRQAGKSTLLKQLLPKAPFYDLERQRDYDQISQDSEFFLQQVKKPVILDEAQLLPELFQHLRVAIDENRFEYGQFLLSGSSSPELLSQVTESLAGRAAILEMPPLTWEEARQTEVSPFYQCITELALEQIPNLPIHHNIQQLNELCLYGGYPEPFLRRSDSIFYSNWMENFFRSYIDRDIRKLFPRLKIESYQRFVRMLSVASGQIINAANFASSLDVSEPTVRNYFEIVEGTFLWRRLPSFHKNVTKRVTKMPKGYIRDSGLLMNLFNIHSLDTLQTHPHYGLIWECFLIEQILRSFHAQLLPIQYYYYRTQSRAEIDLLIEGPFGLIPFEFKTGITTRPKQLRTIKAFIEEFDCPCGFVVNQSNQITQLGPRLYEVPAGIL